MFRAAFLIITLGLSQAVNAAIIVSGDYNVWSSWGAADQGNQTFWSNLFDDQAVVTNSNVIDIRIEDYTSATSSITTVTSETLLGADWAVLTTFRGGAYLEQDIVDFVADGGSLWLNSENFGVQDSDGNSFTIDAANSLLEAIGSSISINYDVIDGGINQTTNIFTDPLTANVDTFTILASATLSGGTPLIGSRNDAEKIVVAYDDMPGMNAVPVPAAIWLFGSGLLGMIGYARRRT